MMKPHFFHSTLRELFSLMNGIVLYPSLTAGIEVRNTKNGRSYGQSSIRHAWAIRLWHVVVATVGLCLLCRAFTSFGRFHRKSLQKKRLCRQQKEKK